MCVFVYTVLMHMCVFMCVTVHAHVCIYAEVGGGHKWLYSYEMGAVTELVTRLVASDPQ